MQIEINGKIIKKGVFVKVTAPWTNEEETFKVIERGSRLLLQRYKNKKPVKSYRTTDILENRQVTILQPLQYELF
jgi:hypothetical protein